VTSISELPLLIQASIVMFLGGCFAMGLAVADAILSRLPRLTARLERFIDGGDHA
jgi:hypothetical protein